MANVISKNSLGHFSTSLLHWACDEKFIFTSLKRIASQSYIELKSERIATPALRDNQVDGVKYFLYAYSLSNYESLGEACLFDWRGSREVRLRKRDFKSRLIRQMFANFVGVESSSKGLYQSSGKEKESFCPLFPSSTKREIRHNNVVVCKEMYKRL